MSFFKRITSDAVIFKEARKKKEAKKNKTDDSDKGKNKENGRIKIENCKNVQIGDKYSYVFKNVFNNTLEKEPPECENDSSTPTLPRDIEDNFSKIDEPSMFQFLLVSENIGNNFRALGLELGFTEDEMNSYSANDKDICRMLLDWKRAKTSEATVGRLLKSLWDIREFEAAKRLSDDIQKQY